MEGAEAALKPTASTFLVSIHSSELVSDVGLFQELTRRAAAYNVAIAAYSAIHHFLHHEFTPPVKRPTCME